jgi:hypothetical protein
MALAGRTTPEQPAEDAVTGGSHQTRLERVESYISENRDEVLALATVVVGAAIAILVTVGAEL